jgi:hypothetical protein
MVHIAIEECNALSRRNATIIGKNTAESSVEPQALVSVYKF